MTKHERYNRTAKGRARHARYHATAKARARWRRYWYRHKVIGGTFLYTIGE